MSPTAEAWRLDICEAAGGRFFLIEPQPASFFLDSRPFGSPNRVLWVVSPKSDGPFGTLNSLTSRSKHQYRRHPFAVATISAGSTCRHLPTSGHFLFLCRRPAFSQSCQTRIDRMLRILMMIARPAGSWQCVTFWLILAALAIVPLDVSAAEDLKPDPSSIEFFEKEIRPVLLKNCVSCHGPTQQFSSLRVDSREALLKGGNRGPAVVPGDANLSLLAKAVRHDGLKMPVGGKLAAEEIAAIEKWIQLGAPWPIDKAGSSATASTGLLRTRSRKNIGRFSQCATSNRSRWRMPVIASTASSLRHWVLRA